MTRLSRKDVNIVNPKTDFAMIAALRQENVQNDSLFVDLGKGIGHRDSTRAEGDFGALRFDLI